MCLKIKIFRCLVQNQTDMKTFHPLEVISCGSETDHEVGQKAIIFLRLDLALNKLFIQRRPNVFDVGPTLYKCSTNVLC